MKWRRMRPALLHTVIVIDKKARHRWKRSRA
jgi:hypothetical protein